MVADEVLMDLVIERSVTFGSQSGNAEVRPPFVRLTDAGRDLIKTSQPHNFDPEDYVGYLRTLAPHLDDATAQYALEALRAFRQNLLFASAVMIGAAAETEILRLLQATTIWEPDTSRKQLLGDLLDRGRLPAIFGAINDSVEAARKQGMPYDVHQGTTTHLLSLQEMIRVQRNDAVHPAAGRVSRSKVLLSLQSFPAAFESAERLYGWFSNHPNP